MQLLSRAKTQSIWSRLRCRLTGGSNPPGGIYDAIGVFQTMLKSLKPLGAGSLPFDLLVERLRDRAEACPAQGL